MSEIQQPAPVRRGQANLIRRDGRLRVDGPVTREHTSRQEAAIFRCGRELKVTIEVALGNAIFKAVDDVLDAFQLDHAFHLLPRNQAQLHGRHDSKEAITANDVSEQRVISSAAAFHDGAVRKHHLQRFDVLDERRIHESTPMNVRSDRATEGQSICPRLFLPNTPRARPVALLDHVVAHQVRPGDARLRVNDAPLAIEAEHLVHRPHVE